MNLDGRALDGEADADRLPLPDRLHPDAVPHELIAEHFAALASGPGGPVAETSGPQPCGVGGWPG